MRSFDLSTRDGRYAARRAGLPVPKLKPGVKRAELWAYIETRGPDDCWPWRGRLNDYGYGVFVESQRTTFGHRRAWESATGRSALGLVIMHSCDNRACCNPSHLSAGTNADNVADRERKGRGAKGEGSGTAKLNDELVKKIRAKYSFRRITYAMLAAEYGVCKDTIQKIVRRIYWGHL